MTAIRMLGHRGPVHWEIMPENKGIYIEIPKTEIYKIDSECIQTFELKYVE